ncbi:hypothetical protein PsYK624_105200 [Phanerochaete sordida]|uniref:SH3 domain-containing protein n=1 Tax=Phanerochaete sordida TaxID=48140 RepID=A0A9P3GGG6_9APHY|nr:hypothetical protein PsYK624_105200 [Phanerochaete sordida]
MAIIPKMILCLPSLISKHPLSPFNTRKAEKIAVQEPARVSLTLSVDHTETSPPFPSPGSAFLSPPTLGAHEFATRRSSVERTSATRRKSEEEMNGVNGKPAADGESTPTTTTSMASPVTPTPTTFSPPAQVTIPDPQDATLATPVDKLPDPSTLSSSRPAPPSPAVSRRASSALPSRPSSRARSRPQSRVPSLSQQPVFHTEHQAEGSSSTVVPHKRPPLKIRDFAYPPSDDRHLGRGPDVPRPNRPRNRSSAYSSSGSSACSDDESGDEAQQQHDGFGSFRWNTLSTHFWNGKDGDEDSDADAGPSQNDLAMNFDQSSPVEEQDDYADDDDYYTPPSEDEPLVPGTYRALYTFEPEGTAEMALEEEQLVHVIGRGGGVGWAIVEREGGGHALVPESYLELVTPDAR